MFDRLFFKIFGLNVPCTHPLFLVSQGVGARDIMGHLPIFWPVNLLLFFFIKNKIMEENFTLFVFLKFFIQNNKNINIDLPEFLLLLNCRFIGRLIYFLCPNSLQTKRGR